MLRAHTQCMKQITVVKSWKRNSMVNSVKNHQDHEGKTWCSSSSFFSMSLTASCLSWISAIVSNICHPLTDTMCSKPFLWALHAHRLFLISQACQLKLRCDSLTQCTLPTIMLYSHDKNSVCLQKQDEHTCNTRLDVAQLWESTNLATTLLLNCPLENLLTISSLYELLNHLRSCNVQSHHYVFPQLWWS